MTHKAHKAHPEKCNFGVGLSHWVEVIGYEKECARLREDLKNKDNLLARSEKNLRDKELELQKL